MTSVAFMVGLVFIWSEFWEILAEVQQEAVVWECRDRFLWIRVSSVQTPRLEAVDGNGVHPISNQLASRCGYTISKFRMDSYITIRASYYSCYTHNQDDEVFTFRLNVVVSDDGGRWSSQPISAVCPGLSWTHREMVCEEGYMEVNVNREAPCGGQTRKSSSQSWPEASSQNVTPTPTWQLMFLQSDGRVSSLTLMEAQEENYTLTSSTNRLVLRSPYKQAQAEVTMVDGVAVEVLPVFLFFREKLVVVMVDMTVACTVGLGSFNGSRLLWEVPLVLYSLVTEGVRFENRDFSLGLDNMLLDSATTTSRGLSLVQNQGVIQIRVPFGAEGGYIKSLVENNMYKEVYKVSLLYQHVFTLFYDDGSSIDTRHRTITHLETPLIYRSPVSLNKTVDGQQVFRIHLENVPADVVLEEVWINGNLMSETPEGGFHVQARGSGAYEVVLPFEDPVVRWKYMGGGVIHHSIDVNFSLTIMPQRESYYHHTLIIARTLNSFPPQITAQCLDKGISFSVAEPHWTRSLWELGVGHEALTSELVAQRGYRIFNHSQGMTLEVPIFSIGYTYERINLPNFYATFKLLLRDSKTLEVHTSTSKRCLFRTQDMIVCSADGTMTVVVTPTVTWPTVQPDRTHLLDQTCTPKQTDGVRVLFEFSLDSCGTRAKVGEWYAVYENEILYKRRLIADGSNFISRESKFRVTVRCFYPLAVVNRLSLDRIFRSETPGLGSVSRSHTESSELNTQTNQIHLSPAAERVPSHLNIRLNKVLPETQTTKVSLQSTSLPDHRVSLDVGAPSSNYPQKSDSVSNSIQLMPRTNPGSSESIAARGVSSGPDEHLALLWDSYGSLPGGSMIEPLESSGHTPVTLRVKSLAYRAWDTEPTRNQLPSDQPFTESPLLKTKANPQRTIKPPEPHLTHKLSPQQTKSSKPALYNTWTTLVNDKERDLQSLLFKQDHSNLIHNRDLNHKHQQEHLLHPSQMWQGHGRKVKKSIGVKQVSVSKESILHPTERLKTCMELKENSAELLPSWSGSQLPGGPVSSTGSDTNMKLKGLWAAACSETSVKDQPIS